MDEREKYLPRKDCTANLSFVLSNLYSVRMLHCRSNKWWFTVKELSKNSENLNDQNKRAVNQKMWKFRKIRKWHFNTHISSFKNLLSPVNADDHEYEGGEDVAASPEHHEDLAHEVAGVPLYGQPPEGLHRQRDEADDRVGQGEVKHQVVYIGPGLGRGQRALPAGDHQGDAVQYYANWNNTNVYLRFAVIWFYSKSYLTVLYWH